MWSVDNINLVGHPYSLVPTGPILIGHFRNLLGELPVASVVCCLWTMGRITVSTSVLSYTTQLYTLEAYVYCIVHEEYDLNGDSLYYYKHT